MTATISKTVIAPTWNVEKIQETVAKVQANQMLTVMEVLAKNGGDKAIEEFQTAIRLHKVEHYKAIGVKTPIELAKAIGEFETNVFGSKVEVWGDDKQASIQYNSCAMWNAIEKTGKLTPEHKEAMGAKMQNCMSLLAKEFGFKGETKFEGENSCVVSFSK